MPDPIYQDYRNREAIRALHEASLVPFDGSDLDELTEYQEDALEEEAREIQEDK